MNARIDCRRRMTHFCESILSYNLARCTFSDKKHATTKAIPWEGVTVKPIVKIFTAANVLALSLMGTASAADFYAGKRLTLIINQPAGGPSDIQGRQFADNLARHIAGNPTIIVKNLAGAGGTVGMNFMGTKAPNDGTTFGFMSAVAVASALKPLADRGLQVDPEKYEVVGLTSGASYAYIRSDVAPGIKKPEDIMKTNGFTLLGLRTSNPVDIRERLALDILGLKYNYVTGYRGSSKARIALLQGEGDYFTESAPGFRAKVMPTLVKTGKAVALYFYDLDDGRKIYSPESLSKGLDMISFSAFYKKVKGKEPSGQLWTVFREVNRAANMPQRLIFLPPGAPKEAKEALQAAIAKMNKDPKYQENAKKIMGFAPVYEVGATADQIWKASVKLSPPTLEFLKAYLAKVEQKK
jgi:putative tricarboxylic transport membrane protein